MDAGDSYEHCYPLAKEWHYFIPKSRGQNGDGFYRAGIKEEAGWGSGDKVGMELLVVHRVIPSGLTVVLRLSTHY